MTTEVVVGINHPKVIPIAAEGWAALQEVDGAEPITLLNWDQDAIIAMGEGPSDGAVVGVIVYKMHEWKKELTVELGYVQKFDRHRGVYRAMWKRLVEVAREKKALRITGGVRTTNTAMQAVMEKLGRRPTFITYSFDIDKQDND